MANPVPRTEVAATRDWLSGALLVATGSVKAGEYRGRPYYEAAAGEIIRWLGEHGMRLTIEAEAAASPAAPAVDPERLARALKASNYGLPLRRKDGDSLSGRAKRIAAAYSLQDTVDPVATLHSSDEATP